MVACILYSLPGLQIDRYQEGAYLGTPYTLMNCHTFRITDQDPFPQNSALAVAIPAWLYLHTGSLLVLRVYFSLFTILALFLSNRLIEKHFGAKKISNLGWAFIHLGMFAVWAAIPILLPYSIQTSGAMAGLSAFLGGLLLYPKRKYLAYMLFGLAAHFKGQFLGLSFGLTLYLVLHTYLTERKISAVLREVSVFFVCYFSVPFLMTTFLYLPFGWISDANRYFKSSFSTALTLYDEVSSLVLRLIGMGPHTTEAAKEVIRNRRQEEFVHFRFLSWFLIGSSMLFCLWGIGIEILGKFKSLKNHPLIPVAFAGFIYWVNYLFFYSYPYWYNTLAVLWFSVIIFPLLGFYFLERKNFSKNFVAVACLLCVLVSLRSLKKSISLFQPGVRTGTALLDYEWKTHPVKCD